MGEGPKPPGGQSGYPESRSIVRLLLALLLSGVGGPAGQGAGAQQLERYRVDSELLPIDRAVLDRRAELRGLRCKSTLMGPRLGFDFRFSGTLQVRIPYSDLAGREEALSVVARLQPLAGRGAPAFFKQQLPPPRREAGARGIQLSLNYAVGEGRYRLDWLIRNRLGEGCSRRHGLKVKPSRRNMVLRMGPGEAVFFQGESFGFERLNPDPSSGSPLHVKVLLNLPPFKDLGRRLFMDDVLRVLAILREIASHPRVGKLDLVAFNLKDQRVIYDQRGEDFIDYPGLYHAISALDDVKIQANALRMGADTEFLTGLLRAEFESPGEAEAVILVGPRLELKRDLDRQELAGAVEAAPPTFYLRYQFGSFGANWGDAVTPFVKWAGGTFFSIQEPLDLRRSVQRMMQLLDTGRERTPTAASADQKKGGGSGSP